MRRPDDSFLGLLEGIRPRPVFILGLHRSGTTFLDQRLAAGLPVAPLTVLGVVRYDRLLDLHDSGALGEAGRALDETFRGWGMDTRRIDEVALSHDMPEEYGWILRRRAGSFRVNRRTAPVLDEICRKLHRIHPEASAVLLKNPWDAGRGARLLAIFPEARFIVIRRDPVAIVNSQFRVARYFGGTRDRFIELLFRGIPFGRTWLRVQRVVRRAGGPLLHARIALARILRDVARETERLEASWRALPEPRRMAVDYESLVRDPDEVLARAGAFLGLPVRPDRARVPAKPRDPALLPEVAAVEAIFRRRLEKMGDVSVFRH